MKKMKFFLATFMLALLLSSCMTLTHVVGTGGSSGDSVEQKQWYALWGLVPINEVNSKEMAGGAANYTITSQQKFVDVIISAFTGIVTVTVQNVSIQK